MRHPTLAMTADQGTGFEQYRKPAPRDEVLATMQRSRPGAISNARVLGIFGDSVTTDHISLAGAIKDSSPAGKYLLASDVAKTDFNSYGARRGNHEVMMRGTFANVRIKNLMVPGSEGGITLHQPDCLTFSGDS